MIRFCDSQTVYGSTPNYIWDPDASVRSVEQSYNVEGDVIPQDRVNKMTPGDVGEYWRSGVGGHLYSGPGSEMSKQFRQGNGAKYFESWFVGSFNDADFFGHADNFDYTFTWVRAALTTNSAEHIVGSYENGIADVLGDQIKYTVFNTASYSSLFFGRQLVEAGIKPVGPKDSDLQMTIRWVTPVP